MTAAIRTVSALSVRCASGDDRRRDLKKRLVEFGKHEVKFSRTRMGEVSRSHKQAAARLKGLPQEVRSIVADLKEVCDEVLDEGDRGATEYEEEDGP